MAKFVNRTAYRLVGLLPSLCFITHCAARGPATTPSQLAEIARADALVREGCYRCLQDALGIYASLTDPARRRSPDRALRGAFEATLLLAVREKELGLGADGSLARARALLARLSRPAVSGRTPAQEDLSTLLEAADAIVGDVSALDAEERQRRDEVLQQRGGAADRIGRLQPVLHKSAATDLTAAYLALAIDCEQPRNRRSFAPAPVFTQDGGPPLMRYRVAICSDGPPTSLSALRDADPRWAEAFFFEGKYEMGSPSRASEPARAAALLASASQAFPGSIAIRMLLAKAQETDGDFAGALANLDRILGSNPAHVDARLARVRTLSYLGRTDEGIAAATTLIDLGTWHVGDAYYWRAWNEYQARRVAPAWADIQHAMRLRANTAVYALAGSIAYARRDLDTAVRHFDDAFEMDATNCPAVSSAGTVHIDRAAWQAAADSFSRATNCFALAASTARMELARLEQSALEPATKARRVSDARKRIESAEELGGQSALNTAQAIARIASRR